MISKLLPLNFKTFLSEHFLLTVNLKICNVISLTAPAKV